MRQDKDRKALIAEMKALKCTSGLSPEAVALLATVSVKRTFATSEIIWEMGDPGECIAVVVSGLIEISRHTRSAKEIILGLFGPSDVVGISAVIRKTTYPGTAKALVPGTEILKVFIRQISQERAPAHTEIQTWLREMLLRHEQVLRDKIDVVNAGTVEHRVFELLSQLARRFGNASSRSRVMIPLRITRAQIGKLTDVRVETIIRLLSRWQKQKLLHWTQEGIVVESLSQLEKHLD